VRRVILALPLALAACASLPEPFLGNPGPEGARLAVPKAPVLVVPTPANAALPPKAAALYASDLAAALANADVPSVAGPADKTEWNLAVTAKTADGAVTPTYAITGPDQKLYGTLTGSAVPAGVWSAGDPTVLQTTAAADSLALAHKLSGINAQLQGSDPTSLENRTPRLYLTGVSGAPGDGDTSLALNFSRDVNSPDLELVTDPARADFTVTGVVKVSPLGGGQDMVELDWLVKDINQRLIGQVTQLHQLADTDMSPYWGDVAAAAATEAAGGVQEAVAHDVLPKAGADQPSANAATPSTASPASP
jgi:hypothetical protein